MPPSKRSTSSPLLNLPAELRNTVYRLALTTDDAITINRDTFSQRIALLQTCRTIRDEATSIFYAESIFHLPLDGEQNAASLAWLELSRRNLTHIRSLVLRPGLSEVYWKITLAPLAGKTLKRWEAGPFEQKINTDRDCITTSLDATYAAGLRLNAVEVSPLPERKATESSFYARWYFGGIFREMHFWVQDKRRDEIERQKK